MIKVYLLTGFLGAGKTTFLQSLLDSYHDRKLGVIINEFGEINIDARLIKKDGIEMAELSNGSIFCACIKDKFVNSLIEMSSRDLDVLLIEASGLADPANMSQILDGIRHYTTNGYQLGGAICIVDGRKFLDLIEILPALENQVAYANAIILNKVDLMNAKKESEIKRFINKLNPGVSVYVTAYCKVDIREMMDNFSVTSKESSDSTNTFKSRPNSFVLQSSGRLNYDSLFEFLKEIASDSYRMKGFVNTDRGSFEISTVGSDIEMKPWTDRVAGAEIVVISSVGIKMISNILSASQKYLDGGLKLK